MEQARTVAFEEESLPLFRFDPVVLQEVQSAIPAELLLLRLRLRFGVPGRVQAGQRFRVVVDLVDEMGQPAPESLGLELPEGLDLHVACREESSHLELKIEENRAPASSTQRSKWVYHALLAPPRGSSLPPSGVHATLTIRMKQTWQEPSEVRGYRHLLQAFCVGSAWLNEHALVLPLQVALHVTSTSGGADKVVTSTACTRLFRAVEGGNDSSLIVIEENYGDAMGSHVWDASVLLSFLVRQAGTAALVTSHQNTLAVLELGSGCGLLATVLAKRQSPHTAAIFTEKAESTARLQANLDRNASPASALVLPLEWGAPLPCALRDARVRVVFAADVLYNWAAHEAFLATLDALVRAEDPSTGFHVFLAHKRRGKASAANLNALATGAFEAAAQCEASSGDSPCRWLRWHVQKLSSLGRVELFRLTAITR